MERTYHSNGKTKWVDGTAYHPNGQKAWTEDIGWHSNSKISIRGGYVWHANGKTAYNNGKAWHANGHVAWNNGHAFHSNGNNAGHEGLEIKVGEGIYLGIGKYGHYVIVYGKMVVGDYYGRYSYSEYSDQSSSSRSGSQSTYRQSYKCADCGATIHKHVYAYFKDRRGKHGKLRFCSNDHFNAFLYYTSLERCDMFGETEREKRQRAEQERKRREMLNRLFSEACDDIRDKAIDKYTSLAKSKSEFNDKLKKRINVDAQDTVNAYISQVQSAVKSLGTTSAISIVKNKKTKFYSKIEKTTSFSLAFERFFNNFTRKANKFDKWYEKSGSKLDKKLDKMDEKFDKFVDKLDKKFDRFSNKIERWFDNTGKKMDKWMDD